MENGRKVVPREFWAESTRKKQNEWNKENRVVLAASVPRETGDRFKLYCAGQGKSVSSVLADYVISCISSEGSRD